MNEGRTAGTAVAGSVSRSAQVGSRGDIPTADVGVAFWQLLERITQSPNGCTESDSREEPVADEKTASRQLPRGGQADGNGRCEDEDRPAVAVPVRDATFDREMARLVGRGSGAEPTERTRTPVAVLETLGREMIRAASVEQLHGITSVRLQLSTPELRHVQLRVRLDRGELHTTFSLGDEAEYQLIRGASQELEAALRARGLEPAAVEVIRNGGQGTASHGDQTSGGRRWRQVPRSELTTRNGRCVQLQRLPFNHPSPRTPRPANKTDYTV